ncbi:hypothetical protein BH09VER1_BH09VER1_54730 [soil metagenome]
MKFTMRQRRGFTLIELLVVIVIIGILAVMIGANWKNMILWSQRSSTLNNMRQVGIAVYNYAGDNNSLLPRRVVGTNDGDKWPKLLSAYLDDVRVYAATGDRSNYIFQGKDPLDNHRNYTSYIMNGYNDVGAFTNPQVEVRLSQLEKPASVILFGTPNPGSTHFYMDLLEAPHGNQNDVLNLTNYGNGSDYIFADGSARFITQAEYLREGGTQLWLVDKGFSIPTL